MIFTSTAFQDYDFYCLLVIKVLFHLRTCTEDCKYHGTIFAIPNHERSKKKYIIVNVNLIFWHRERRAVEWFPKSKCLSSFSLQDNKQAAFRQKVMGVFAPLWYCIWSVTFDLKLTVHEILDWWQLWRQAATDWFPDWPGTPQPLISLCFTQKIFA